MPVYRLQGKDYNLPDGLSPEEAQQRILSYLASQQPQQQPQQAPVEEDGGHLGAAWSGAKLAFNAPGYVMSGGESPAYDAAKQEFDAASKNYPISGAVGKYGSMFAAAVPGIAAGVMGAPVLAATAAAALPYAALTGMERGAEVHKETGDVGTATAAGLTRGATSAVDVALPASIPGKLALRVGSGAAMGVGMNMLDAALQNKVTSEYENLYQDPFDPTSLAIGGVISGTVGGALGGRIGKRPSDSKADQILPPEASEQLKNTLHYWMGRQSDVSGDLAKETERLAGAKTARGREVLQGRVERVSQQLAEINKKVDLLTSGGRPKPEVVSPTEYESVKAEYDAADREANDLTGKILEARRQGRTDGVPNLEEQVRLADARRTAAEEKLKTASRQPEPPESVGLVEGELAGPREEVPGVGEGLGMPSRPDADPRADIPPVGQSAPKISSDILSAKAKGDNRYKVDSRVRGKIADGTVNRWSDHALDNAIAAAHKRLENVTYPELKPYIEDTIRMLEETKADRQRVAAKGADGRGNVFTDASSPTDPQGHNLRFVQSKTPAILAAKIEALNKRLLTWSDALLDDNIKRAKEVIKASRSLVSKDEMRKLLDYAEAEKVRRTRLKEGAPADQPVFPERGKTTNPKERKARLTELEELGAKFDEYAAMGREEVSTADEWAGSTAGPRDDVPDMGERNILEGERLQREASGMENMRAEDNIGQHLSSRLDLPGLSEAIKIGGFHGGLQHVIDKLPTDHPFHSLAKTLLENRHLSPDVRQWDADFMQTPTGKAGHPELEGNRGIWTPSENLIDLFPKGLNDVTTLLHEAIHAALQRATRLWQTSGGRGLSGAEKSALHRLEKLYDYVVANYPKAEGLPSQITFKEFMTYGTTHPRFMAILGSMKMPNSGQSILRRMGSAIKDFFGMSNASRSAYDELTGAVSVLLRHSSGVTPDVQTKIMNRVYRGPIIKEDLTPTQVVEETLNTPDISGGWLTRLGGDLIGKQQLRNMWDNPVISYTALTISRAESRMIALRRGLLDGMSDLAPDALGKRFIKLGHYNNEKSLRRILDGLSDEEGNQLSKIDKRFFDEGEAWMREQRAAEEMKPWQQRDPLTVDTVGAKYLERNVAILKQEGVSPKLIEAYTARTKAHNALLSEVNKVHTLMGNKEVPFRPGWYPSVRKGQYALLVSQNDVVFRMEQFRTEAEAIYKQKRIAETPGYQTEIVDMVAAKANAPKLSDEMQFAYDMFTRVGLDEYTPELRAIFSRMQEGVGKHGQYRENIGGAMGDEWFKTPAQQGASYKRAIFDSIDEFTSILKTKEIQHNTSQLLGETADPRLSGRNDIAMATKIRDIAINNVPEWVGATAFDKVFRDVGDKMAHNLAKMFGKDDYFPRVNPAEKTLGVMSSLFYLSTLTNRPGFWVSQLLTSPMAIRHLLKDDSIPLVDVMSHFVKGTFNAFGGAKISPDRAAFIRYLANETNSLHPQLMNELNDINLLSPNANKLVSKIFRVISGQKPAEMADSFSRYWTASMMYEMYKGKGLVGKDLWEASVRATDDTMVMYDRSNKAAWVGKAGILGQAVNPLMTFGTAQFANLIGDIRYAARTRTLRSTLPVISTFAVTQLMAGAVGLPLLVEYQFLRDYIVEMDPEYAWMPSPKEILLSQPAVLARGVPSAVTGFDIGSGMRWNPFLNKFLLNDSQSLWQTLPAIAFIGDVAKAVAAETKNGLFNLGLANPMPEHELRKLMLKFTPGVPTKFIVENIMFDSEQRSNVPGGRGQSMMFQGDKEYWAPLLGSRTNEQALAQDFSYANKQRTAQDSALQRKYVDVLTDGVLGGNQARVDSAIEKLSTLNLTGEEILELVRKQAEIRNTPEIYRLLQGEGPGSIRKKLRVIGLLGDNLSAVAGAR